ncbi:MAG: cytochrome c family protein, partial [Methanomethylovorans sp.]|nr:cytochrome c family protein [Methanomethylovorans sp.]
IPEDVTYPLTIIATLQYRSAPQDLIDHLFGEDVYEVPVISMTEISTNIYENEEAAADAATPATPGTGILGSVTILLCAAYYYMERRKI